ncbi:MAG: neutral/alkaline non-lysosomal ceramidase N-terminal domain-containing protein [Candidatus Hydrogenedentes bacterium]|nr:neutral/alkaline non-lysosomal ceramidase N-terminal domain-containing protein [Candidatus Hydrogenedentota bacterium]
MTRKKTLIAGFVGLPAVLAAAFLIVIGPWPAYQDSRYRESDYYRAALDAIAASASKSEKTASPGRLHAGWAKRAITPEIGAPLGGYSGRKGGMESTGVRDELYVRALALHDGVDTAVILGSDMLIIPPNLSSAVLEQVGARTGLTPDQILFNASHTHCGPGGFMPGLVSKFSGGAYDEARMARIIAAFAEAAVEAHGALEPASIAAGSADAPEYIRNRTRDGAPVDSELSFMLVRQDDGDVCYVASYSAHPTVFGSRMMAFSAEYPGELMRFIEEETGHDALYLGGAVGSMGPRAPEGEDDGARVTAMGRALGSLILASDDALAFTDHADIAPAGAAVGMPPFQLRPFENRPHLRLSPAAGYLLGLRREGWIHGVRIGDLFLVGTPFDFCGETSVVWKEWAREHGLDLWALSFCSTYCGYLSPDKHYWDVPLNYETGPMGWFGPNTEAYFTDLFQALVQGLAVTEGRS